jgi:ATP-dependent Clp protease ATP-binding subunit ClpC
MNVWLAQARVRLLLYSSQDHTDEGAIGGTVNGMNFTERVRKVLALAKDEAVSRHHQFIGTEHILLGLIREGEGVGATILKTARISPAEIRQKIDELLRIGEPDAHRVSDLPYTTRAKKVLELSMSEARDQDENYVGTEHILLGLLREEKGIAAQVLNYAGLTVESARAEADHNPPPTSSEF